MLTLHIVIILLIHKYDSGLLGIIIIIMNVCDIHTSYDIYLKIN